MSNRRSKGYTGFVGVLALGLAVVLLASPAYPRPQEGARQKAGPDLWGKRMDRMQESMRDADLPRSSRAARIGPRIRSQSYFRYQTVGGDEGVDRVLTIRGDGSARLMEDGRVTRTTMLESHILKQVARVLKKKDSFKKLEPVYGEKTADPFQQTTTLMMHVAQRPQTSSQGNEVRGEVGKTTTVIVYHDPEHPAPLEVTRILVDLEELVEKRLTERPETPVEFYGVAATGMIDRHLYQVVRSEEPEIPSLWFNFSIVNFTPLPLSIHFPSSQPYEIVIRSEAGEEVYRWSKGKEFPADPVDLELTSDWVSYIEQIPLTGIDGQPLSPGIYTLAYESLGDPAFRGETTFQIEEVDPPEKKQPFRGVLARHRAAMSAEGQPSKAGAGAAQEGAGGGKGAKGGGKKKKKGGG